MKYWTRKRHAFTQNLMSIGTSRFEKHHDLQVQHALLRSKTSGFLDQKIVFAEIARRGFHLLSMT